MTVIICHFLPLSPACVSSQQVDNTNTVNEPTGNDKLYLSGKIMSPYQTTSHHIPEDRGN